MLTLMVLLNALSAAPANAPGLFDSQLNADGAQVTTSRQLPQSRWTMACRHTLTQPIRQATQQQLGQQLQLKLPENVSFFAGEITGYRQWKKDGWLHCRGEVQPKSASYLKSMLAVRVAWWANEHDHKSWLRGLLQVALAEPDSATDALALVAENSSEPKANAAVKQLDYKQLRLPQAMLAVAKRLRHNQALHAATQALTNCDEPTCRQLKAELKDELDQQEADSLCSYLDNCSSAGH